MSRSPRRLLTAAASALGLVLSLSVVGLPAQQATAAGPRKIDCPQVKEAPVLPDDLTVNGKAIKPKADRRGVFVPVIMVPDWSGMADHGPGRTGDFSPKIDMGAGGPAPPAPQASLIGQIQRIPGAAVYTFDYRGSAGRWVDDPAIGPALGDAIDCVSSALGQKVILVTRGIGALAARYAVGGLTADRNRGDKVSTVIGYGGPQSGSLMAELLNRRIGATASEPRTALRLLLASCAALPPTTVLAPDAPCRYLPALAKVMAGPAGPALRGSSPELLGLLDFPPTVALHALVGETQFQAPQLGWFGLRPFRTTNISVGDLVSSTASTTLGAQSQLRAACNFQLDAFGGPQQSAGLRFAEVAVGGGAVPGLALPWASTARPCFSGSLTRIQQFADSVAGVVTKEIRNRQPINLKELESLEVPSLCGFPAGKLVGGRLPIPETEGVAGLASTLFPPRTSDFTVFGDITGDGTQDTIVVLRCSTVLGGAGPDTVAAYDNYGKLLGSVNLGNITKLEKNEVYQIVVQGGRVLMRWATTRASDEACCPTVDVSATFTYDPTKGIVPGDRVNAFHETEIAQKILDAIKARRKGRAAKLSSVEIATAMLDADKNYGGLGRTTCHGSTALDDNWPTAAREAYGDWPPVDGLSHGERFCLIDLGGRPVALLGMHHLGFRDWKAVEFRIPGDAPNVNETTPPDGGTFPDPLPTFNAPDDPGGGPLFPGPLDPNRKGTDRQAGAQGQSTPPPGRAERR
jgi:hypothetical protein